MKQALVTFLTAQRIRRLLNVLILAPVIIFVFNSSAPASTATDSVLFGDPSGEVPMFSEMVSLEYYDGIETLSAVTFTMTLTVWDGSFSFDNDGASSANVDIDLAVGAFMTSTDVSLPSESAYGTVYTNSITLAANDGDSTRAFNSDSGDDFAYLNTGSEIVTLTWTADADDLTDFYGTGTYDITVVVSELLYEISGDSGVAIQTIPPLVTGMLAVDYETTAVPVPATMILFGTGLGGLILTRRRNFGG